MTFPVEKGQKLNVLLRPEDLRVDEIHGNAEAEGLIGYVRERNYKGMTLESVVELENGKMVMVSEFFNEDDPDFDHSLDQKMAINWVESWEVVLADEETNTSKFQNVVIATIVGWLVLFVFLPNLMIIATSFLTRDDAHFVSLVFTLDNYARLLDPLYFDVLLHSLNMALIATLCLPGAGLSVRLVPGGAAAEGAAAAAVFADCALLDQLADPHLRAEDFPQHQRLSQ